MNFSFCSFDSRCKINIAKPRNGKLSNENDFSVQIKQDLFVQSFMSEIQILISSHLTVVHETMGNGEGKVL